MDINIIDPEIYIIKMIKRVNNMYSENRESLRSVLVLERCDDDEVVHYIRTDLLYPLKCLCSVAKCLKCY